MLPHFVRIDGGFGAGPHERGVKTGGGENKKGRHSRWLVELLTKTLKSLSTEDALPVYFDVIVAKLKISKVTKKTAKTIQNVI